MSDLIFVVILVASVVGALAYLIADRGRRRSEPDERRKREEEKQLRYDSEQLRRARLDSEQVERLWTDYQDIIAKFFEIAERKVSILDDYGDESWRSLPKEILECLCKIGDREGVTREDIREWFKHKDESEWRLEFGFGQDRERQFLKLFERLENAFRDYHEKLPYRPGADLNGYSGADFESYIARLLRATGLEDIRGTPTTGDQGADLLARKDGRLIVIQAKRHRGPVGNGSVQEVAAAVRFYDGDEGWVITNSTFTPGAKALAQKNGIRLVDGAVLATWAQGDTGNHNLK